MTIFFKQARISKGLKLALENGNQCLNNTTGMSKEEQGQEIECW